MTESVHISILPFCLIYILLIFIAVIMKKSSIDKTTLLFTASLRMTVQLILAGFILTYLFKNPNAIFTFLYFILMISFAIWQTLHRFREMNRNFKLIVGMSIGLTGFFLVLFFVVVVAQKSFFNPQYTIPVAGMIVGNTMTGVGLGLKSFWDNLKNQKNRLETLLNLGVSPKNILLPTANNALETAILPTINSFMGMGIVFMPGMMTGQMLSGTPPMTAILYQISIMIAICTAVCISIFLSLHFGIKTLYNKQNQIVLK